MTSLFRISIAYILFILQTNVAASLQVPRSRRSPQRRRPVIRSRTYNRLMTIIIISLSHYTTEHRPNPKVRNCVLLGYAHNLHVGHADWRQQDVDDYCIQLCQYGKGHIAIDPSPEYRQLLQDIPHLGEVDSKGLDGSSFLTSRCR